MQGVHVGLRRRRRQVAAVAAHALVNNQHAGIGGLLVDDVGKKLRAFLRGGPRPQRLLDGHLRGASRSLDSVRMASKSKKKPPTTSSPGDDARRWREGTAAPRDAESAPVNFRGVLVLGEGVVERELLII